VAAPLEEGDFDTASRMILGAEQWERFATAGGSWKILNSIIKDARGADAGE
jgi:hypothetical protein